MNKTLFFYFALCISIVTAQTPLKIGSLKQANEKFKVGNYDGALEEYLLLKENNPVDDKLDYNIAVCYLNTNIDKEKALPYLEKIVKLPKYDPNAMYLLGRAYHFSNRFDDALKCYKEFRQMGLGTEDNLADVDLEIEYCYNAKEIIKFPIDFTFENLEKNINSQFPDYYPFISNDESFLLYNTRRDENSKMAVSGQYMSNVYVSYEKDGKWLKSKSIGENINSVGGDEEIVGCSADGNTLIYNFDNNIGFGDIFIGPKEGSSFFTPIKLNQNINSREGEISASISPDGKTLYFTSNRPGGYGGMDIYRAVKLPNGEWSQAYNLGKNINTQFDEDFPTISKDGKTLYFSSKGHTSMGGYDIFKTMWSDSTNGWVNLKNVGYPINTSDDNMNLCMEDQGRYGYISALRKEGMGDLDIYRVVFNTVEPKYTLITGLISSSDNVIKKIT